MYHMFKCTLMIFSWSVWNEMAWESFIILNMAMLTWRTHCEPCFVVLVLTSLFGYDKFLWWNTIKWIFTKLYELYWSTRINTFTFLYLSVYHELYFSRRYFHREFLHFVGRINYHCFSFLRYVSWSLSTCGHMSIRQQSHYLKLFTTEETTLSCMLRRFLSVPF